MTKRIRVTKHDIRQGFRDNSSHCPVAIAMRRQLPRIGALVNQSKVWLYPRGQDDPDMIKVLFSLRTYERIRKFDDGGRMKPFSFVLHIPKELQRRVA